MTSSSTPSSTGSSPACSSSTRRRSPHPASCFLPVLPSMAEEDLDLEEDDEQDEDEANEEDYGKLLDVSDDEDS